MTLVTIHISSGFPIYFCSRLNVFNEGIIIVYQLVSILRKLLDSIAFQVWSTTLIYEMFCTTWYHQYNFTNVKNTHGGVLPLVKLQASVCNFTISNTTHECFLHFFNCTNGIKSRKALHILIKSTTFINCCFKQFYISGGFNINAIYSKLLFSYTLLFIQDYNSKLAYNNNYFTVFEPARI